MQQKIVKRIEKNRDIDSFLPSFSLGLGFTNRYTKSMLITFKVF